VMIDTRFDRETTVRSFAPVIKRGIEPLISKLILKFD
jgi:hypothetical protein